MQNVPNQNLATYFRERNNRSLAPPLRSSIINRTVTERRSTFRNGATAENFMFPSVSATTSQKITITDPVRAPTDPDAQTLTIPTLSALEDDLDIPIYTSSANHFNGLFDGTTFQNPSVNTVVPTIPNTPGPVPQGPNLGFIKSHPEIVDGNFFALPEGMVLGFKSLVTGATMNVGRFAFDNFNLGDLSKGGFRYTGDGTTFGPAGVWRPFSALALQSIDNTTGSGFTVADIQGALDLINVGPVITVNPPSNNVTASMKFTLHPGAKWIGDDVLQDKLTGRYLNIVEGEFSDGSMVDYVDTTTGNFKTEFVIDLALMRITQTFNIQAGDGIVGTNVVSFLPGTVFDTSFDVSGTVRTTTATGSYVAFMNAYLSGEIDLVFPTGTGSGLSVQEVTDEDGVVVNTVVPNYTDRNNSMFATNLRLPTGTTYSIPILSKDGMQFPRGFAISQLSSVSALPPTGEQVTNSTLQPRKVFSASNAILSPNSFVFNDTKIISIIGTSEQSEVPENSITNIPQSFLPSSTWDEPAVLTDVVLASGHKAQSYIKLLDGQVVGSELELTDDSLLKANSVLPPGLITRNGMRSDKDIDFPTGTPINFVLDLLNTPINIDALNNTNRLISGTLIRAIGNIGTSELLRTILPNGFVLTNGNKYPANVRIYATENVMLDAGSVLEDPTFGPNFVLTQTQLESGFVFTASTTLSTGVSLPSSTLIEAGNKFPFPLPLPRNHIFPAGSRLPVGLNFAAGSRLPGISMRPQEDALRVIANSQTIPAVNNVPYLTAVIGSKLYIILAKNTVMNTNATIPKGAVMLNQNGFTSGTTGSVQVGAGPGFATSFTTGVYASGNWVTGATAVYTIDEAEFSYTQGSGTGVSIGPYTFDIGVPTTNPMILRGELRLPFDLAFPFSDNNETMRSLTFAVDFMISREVTINHDVIVDDDSSVFVPTDLPLPWDVTLTSEFILPSSVSLLKKITLPTSDVSDYIENILSDPSAFIRLPGHITSPGKNIRLSPLGSGLYISTLAASNATKAFIEVKRGTTVSVTNPTDNDSTGYRLRAPLPLNEDWLVLQDIVSSPPFVVAGIRLAAGSLLPGEISVGNTTPFPGGLTTSTEIILLEDFTVTNPEGILLTIPEGAFLETNSIIARDSLFNGGSELSNVEYGPVSFWNDGGKMYVYQGQNFPSSLFYNYFSSTVPYSVVQDVSTLTESISDLSNIVALQQSSLTAAQSSIVSLNDQVSAMQVTQASQAGVIASQSASITALQQRVAALEATVAQLQV